MSIFGFYFVTGLLREAGWPRRKGLFNSTAVIDTIILDEAINQMVDWGAALGAGRPTLALQAVAEMFRDRDWSSDGRPDIRAFIESARAENENWRVPLSIAPHDVVQRTRLSGDDAYRHAAEGLIRTGWKWRGPTTTVKDFKQMRLALEQWFLAGVLWGFANPDAFEAWYQAQFEDRMTKLELMRESGLAIEPPVGLAQFLADSEEILRNYERDIDPLPAIPESLLADAQAIGRRVFAAPSGGRSFERRQRDFHRALKSVYDETLREDVPSELKAQGPDETITGAASNFFEGLSKNRGKILALIGVGLYVPWVISSAEDMNANSLASDTFILLSGNAIVIYLVIAAIVLWKIGHKGVALALPITFIGTAIAVSFLTPNRSTINIVPNALKIIWALTYFYAAWLMFVSDRRRIVTR